VLYAHLILIEKTCATCSVSLLQNRLWRDDVHVPHHIPETEPEQLHLPWFSDCIQEPVINIWSGFDGRTCDRLYEPGKVSCPVESVTEFLETTTIKWLIPFSQLSPQKGATTDRNKPMAFL
jgi:hypothetical protein